MMIRRCKGWSPTTHGRARWLGIVSWKGWRVTFSDGMCPACGAAFAAKHKLRVRSAERDAR